MPFRSEAQRRFLFATQPELALRWAHKYGTPKNLPMHVKKAAGPLRKLLTGERSEEQKERSSRRQAGLVRGLEKGDVLVMSPERGTARGIEGIVGDLYQHGPNLMQGGLAHSAIYMGDGDVVESHVMGVVRRPLHEAVSGKTFVALRPKLSEKHRDEAADFAAKQVGKPYNYPVLLVSAAGTLLPEWMTKAVGERLIPKPRESKAFTCSHLVAASYAKAQLGRLGALTTPADLRFSDKMERVKLVVADEGHLDAPLLGRLPEVVAAKRADAPLLSKEKRRAMAHNDAFFGAEDKGKKWGDFDADVARKSFVKSLVDDPRADEKLKLHADRMNRLKTGKLVGQVQGATATYDIVRLRGGGLGCSCPDWRYKRSVAPEADLACKHIVHWTQAAKATKS